MEMKVLWERACALLDAEMGSKVVVFASRNKLLDIIIFE